MGEIYREESRRILAILVRLLGDIDRAEEALQDAFNAALEAWPRDGVPGNPRAWLISTARFRGIDALRRDRRGSELIRERAGEGGDAPPPEDPDENAIRDDQLRLLFTCCHPEVPIDGRVALSLRVVCGLTTEEIARSFLVSTPAMKRRITRAKATIREKRLPYAVPPRTQLPARLSAVLHVIYLVYNEGYSASSGPDHLRRDLAVNAVSLGRTLAELLPEPEVLGLLALLLFHESRVAARTDREGDLVPLEAQDRTLWDRELIAEGMDLLRRAMTSGRVGPYTLQAAIASVHAAAPSVERTNWGLVVDYYDMLGRLQSSPVVSLHRAIAVGMRDGPGAGLELIDSLLETGALANHHLAHAARAEFAARNGEPAAAERSYRRALELVRQDPERRYLEVRLAAVRSGVDEDVPSGDPHSTIQ